MSRQVPADNGPDVPGPAADRSSARHPEPPPVDRALASRRVWDRLSELERLQQLYAMDQAHAHALEASLPMIEQAKGILMGCQGCDASAAFAALSRASWSQNLTVRDLAALVVEAATKQPDPPEGPALSPCEQVRLVLRDDGADGRVRS